MPIPAEMHLSYVPPEEFERILAMPASRTERAAVFADLCRLNVLYAVARAGSGHLGTSFSCLDLLSWLYLEELDPGTVAGGGDIVFSSKGHDVPAFYSVLTALGRLPFEKLHLLRRLGGLPGHPDVSVPHLHTNTGSLGMGISKAKGMARGRRITAQTGRIFVVTGDGELQEGQFWESLGSAANEGLGEITAIVDHNKIQSDTYVADVSGLGDLEAKFASFGWHVERVDGHDLEAIAATFARLRAVTDQPKLVIADTVKGRGVSRMEHTRLPRGENYRFHSGAPSAEDYAAGVAELTQRIDERLAGMSAPAVRLVEVDRPPPAAAARAERLVGAYSRALVEAGERDPGLVVLDADLVLDCGLIPFRDRFPERFVECGIAEQDMVSQAGGLALAGLLPFVHSFACFLTSRPNEQVYNNATERTKVVYVGSLAGLLPAGPGHSHQAVRDIASLGGIPGLVMIEPSCEAEVAMAVDFCRAGTPSSCYLRLVSIPVEIPFELPAGYRLEPGRGVRIREGTDAIIVGYGPILLAQAYRAAEALESESGVRVGVVNLPWLNQVEAAWLARLAGETPMILFLDNHYEAGGQGQRLLAELAGLGLERPPRARHLGVRELPLCGANDEVLAAHRLDSNGIAAAVRRELDALRRLDSSDRPDGAAARDQITGSGGGSADSSPVEWPNSRSQVTDGVIVDRDGLEPD